MKLPVIYLMSYFGSQNVPLLLLGVLVLMQFASSLPVAEEVQPAPAEAGNVAENGAEDLTPEAQFHHHHHHHRPPHGMLFYNVYINL